jgi:hypothetical protein
MLNASRAPGRRVYSYVLPASLFRRRYSIELQRGMQRPPGWVVDADHQALITDLLITDYC